MGAPKQEASAAIEEETINSFFSEDNRRALARESSEGFFFGPLREWTYYGLVSAHQKLSRRSDRIVLRCRGSLADHRLFQSA